MSKTFLKGFYYVCMHFPTSIVFFACENEVNNVPFLTHSHPFSPVLSLFGSCVPCLGIYSVLHSLRQGLVKTKSTSFLNSKTKVELLRVTEIQFRTKVTCHLKLKFLSCLLYSHLLYFTSDVLVHKGFI